MSLLQNSNAISTGGGYNLTDSVRFRQSASAYLDRTPTTAGNRKTWTWSAWIKKSSIMSTSGTDQSLFHAYSGSGATQQTGIFFTTYSTIIDSIRIESGTQGVSQDFDWGFSNTYRDPSAWYHIVIAFDTANATASERCKVYVNSIELTSKISYAGRATTVSQNYETAINNNIRHTIGGQTSGLYLDGYLTEVNFVDGQALTPSDFGETDTVTGVWKPIKYTGTYGTNGFYLPMKQTTQAEGFNTVLYTGTGATQSITGVGFSPDFVWLKSRSLNAIHAVFDTVRGGTKRLRTNDTVAEDTSTALTAFDADGFTLGNDYSANNAGSTFVAWCWDAGSGSPVSNTDGTITSTVNANTAKGFSVVTYTGNGSTGTVGHGLGSAPEMIIIKNRSQADDWYVWHQSNGAGIYGYLFLNSTDQVRSSTPQFGSTAPDSSVISLTYNTNDWANASGENYVAYCFAEVAGYSKFGSYTGNGSTSGPTITTGFRPAFVMVKRTDATANWVMFDNTRDVDNEADKYLLANSAGVEATSTFASFTDTGFTINTTAAYANASGGSYIYMAFADTRDYQWNFDASGNKNNWTPNNINSNASSETTYDIMSDVPTLTDEDTCNFATWNHVHSNTAAAYKQDGNLTTLDDASNTETRSTISVSSGKWYAEYTLLVVGAGSAYSHWGISKVDSVLTTYIGSNANTWGFFLGDGRSRHNASDNLSYGTGASVGDTIMCALDMDNNKVWWGKNGTWFSSGDPVAGTNAAYTNVTGNICFSVTPRDKSSVNFGQRPFKYTPPTGYKKLNTYNLPDSSIVDGSDYMNVKLWTGNGTNQDIDVGWNPDLVWYRNRTDASGGVITDSIRGDDLHLQTTNTNAEGAFANMEFITNGYNVAGNGNLDNISGKAFVGWHWRASDSAAVSNTNGTITSTVSANTTAGFSVVSYVSNGTNTGTVGHGLSQKPDIVIQKNRTNASDWLVQTQLIDGSNDYLLLNTTAAAASAANGANATTFGSWDRPSGNNMIAYCFAPVEGFSKFGSYTGNGSTDGPFVYTGFRPAFVIAKRTDGVVSWVMFDTGRDTYNVGQANLYPNLTNAEGTGPSIDFLSNGFKLRTASGDANPSGNVIYMAFAENPFKNSLAR